MSYILDLHIGLAYWSCILDCRRSFHQLPILKQSLTKKLLKNIRLKFCFPHKAIDLFITSANDKDDADNLQLNDLGLGNSVACQCKDDFFFFF